MMAPTLGKIIWDAVLFRETAAGRMKFTALLISAAMPARLLKEPRDGQTQRVSSLFKDSTNTRWFASLTVITDHGKQSQPSY
jgi:hypothetical protein